MTAERACLASYVTREDKDTGKSYRRHDAVSRGLLRMVQRAAHRQPFLRWVS